MEAKAAATLAVGKAAIRLKKLRNRISGNSGKAEEIRPATPTKLIKVRKSLTPPECPENAVLPRDSEEVDLEDMQSNTGFGKRISFSSSTKFTELSSKQPAMASTSNAPAMLGVMSEDASFHASDPVFALMGPRSSSESSGHKAPVMIKRISSASEASRLGGSLNSAPLVPESGSGDADGIATKRRGTSASATGMSLNSAPLVPESGSGDADGIATKGRRGTSASVTGISSRQRRLSSSAGIARRTSLLGMYGPSGSSLTDRRPSSGRFKSKIGILAGLSNFDEPKAPERDIRTLEENLAALRFAAIVTISPLRARIIKVFRQFLEPEDHEMVARCVLSRLLAHCGVSHCWNSMLEVTRGLIEEDDADYCNITPACRWMLSTDRTEKDLAEVQWVVGLLAKLNRGEASPASAEYEAVKGIESLVGRLRRKQDQVRPRRVR